MESADVPHFDDPALKQAIHRCCAGECASTDLRQRMAASLASASDISVVPAPQFRRDLKPTLFLFGSNTMAGLGIAAALLLVVGIAAVVLLRSSHENVPNGMALAMVTRHDLCCQGPAHQQGDVPRGLMPAIGNVMRNQLGYPVLAANLVNDGWHFRGASKCPVGDVRSAHFLFDKGDETISVFSLPASSFPAVAQGHRYEAVVQNHPIVCYAKDGGVFGFVGYAKAGELKLAELESLAKSHESDAVVTVTAATTLHGQYAELMHDER